MENTKNRSNFTGKIGFILAAAGSAVGLGNIWRFPYLAAQYGGGIFLLIYIILAVTFGFALMIAEIAIGRKTGLSCVGAFGKLRKKFAFIGWIEAAVPIIVLPYYSVIGGWVIKYFVSFFTGNSQAAAADTFFYDFMSSPAEPLLWFAVFMILTAATVLMGVQKGVENISKILMPVLVVLSLFIAVYTMFIPGAVDGIIYYIKPDFSRFSINTVLAAMGQLFYSMSIAMGIMVTYGSYLKKDVNIESSVKHIEIFDTAVAFLAGLMIIPAVFACSDGNVGQGPGLMFVTLPKVFETMKGGSVIGILFFLLVFFAALTSSVSMMETVVSIIMDKTGLKRKTICVIVFAGAFLLGVPASLGNGVWQHITVLGMDFLTFFDFISNSVIMPVAALLICIFVGYVIKPSAIIEELDKTSPMKYRKMFAVIIKYFAPVCILLILFSSIFSAFGILPI